MSENRVKEFREQSGLTQIRLAYIVGTAPSNLSAIENGRLAPWPKVKRKLARALKTTTEELFPSEVAEAVTSDK